MKNLIKTIIALVFILVSYLTGYYKANEKYSDQLNRLNVQLSKSESKINQLEDSIKSIDKLLNASIVINTIKTDKIVDSPKVE